MALKTPNLSKIFRMVIVIAVLFPFAVNGVGFYLGNQESRRDVARDFAIRHWFGHFSSDGCLDDSGLIARWRGFAVPFFSFDLRDNWGYYHAYEANVNKALNDGNLNAAVSECYTLDELCKLCQGDDSFDRSETPKRVTIDGTEILLQLGVAKSFDGPKIDVESSQDRMVITYLALPKGHLRFVILEEGRVLGVENDWEVLTVDLKRMPGALLQKTPRLME